MSDSSDPTAMTANLIRQMEGLAEHMEDISRLMLTHPSRNVLLHLHAGELRGAAELVRDWIDHLSNPQEADDE